MCHIYTNYTENINVGQSKEEKKISSIYRYIFDSDLVWQICVVYVGNFQPEKCLLIELIIRNLSQIYFVNQKSLKRTFKPGFEYRSPFEFVFSRCEFTKVIL